jgi:hypothetical protein
MLSNASTCFRKSGLLAPIMQPIIGTAARLKGCFLPEDGVDRQHTWLPLEGPGKASATLRKHRAPQPS